MLEIQALWKLLRASWSHNVRLVSTAHTDKDLKSSLNFSPIKPRQHHLGDAVSPAQKSPMWNPRGRTTESKEGCWGIEWKDHWFEKSKSRKYTLGLCHEWSRRPGRHQHQQIPRKFGGCHSFPCLWLPPPPPPHFLLYPPCSGTSSLTGNIPVWVWAGRGWGWERDHFLDHILEPKAFKRAPGYESFARFCH